jgi:hypothetical protein
MKQALEGDISPKTRDEDANNISFRSSCQAMPNSPRFILMIASLNLSVYMGFVIISRV